MLPSNDQIANQSCSSGQQQMATLLGVVEKYTRNRFQLSESVPLWEHLLVTFLEVTRVTINDIRPKGDLVTYVPDIVLKGCVIPRARPDTGT